MTLPEDNPIINNVGTVQDIVGKVEVQEKEKSEKEESEKKTSEKALSHREMSDDGSLGNADSMSAKSDEFSGGSRSDRS